MGRTHRRIVRANTAADRYPAFLFFISKETVCRGEPGLKQRRTAKKPPHRKIVRDTLLQDEWKSDGFMTKEQVMDCFKAFDAKKDEFFGSLNDKMLCRKIRDDMEFTYLSVICAQIRHIMCHVGMCEDAILAFGGNEIPWVAFGEN